MEEQNGSRQALSNGRTRGPETSRRKGFSHKTNDLKSRIPLLQQTKRRKFKKEESFAKAVKSE
jgi:hypothetical protein